MQILAGPHRHGYQAVALAAGGRWLAAVRNTAAVDVWDVSAGRVLFRTPASGSGGGGVWAAPGTLLVWNHLGLTCYRPPDPEPRPLLPHVAWAAAAGGRVVGADWADAGRLFVWQAAAGGFDPVYELRQAWPAGAAVIDPTGGWIARQLYQAVEVRSAVNGGLVHSAPVPTPGTLAGLLDDRRAVYLAESSLTVFDAAAAAGVGRRRLPGRGPVRVAVGPAGQTLLARTGSGVYLLAADTLAVRHPYTFPTLGKPTCVAFAPDGLTAACGTSTGEVVVWDVD